jgi:1-acyl-sn-glycerol-3-phosphate acyltransferase
MILVRSIVFNVLFVLNNALWFIFGWIGIPFVSREKFYVTIGHPWCWSNLWLHRVICGVTVEVRGRENIPPGGIIIAAKHQSAWETLALAASVPNPSFIIKRQLMFIPLFGFYLWWSRQTPINRGDRKQAMAAMNKAAAFTTANGWQLIIFPEGTRRPVDAEPNYKQGIAHLYEACDVPCVPVSHNAGLVWPRRTILKHPGKIIMEFHKPIQPGMPKDEFFQHLRSVIEDGTNNLVAEGRREAPWLR